MGKWLDHRKLFEVLERVAKQSLSVFLIADANYSFLKRFCQINALCIMVLDIL